MPPPRAPMVLLLLAGCAAALLLWLSAGSTAAFAGGVRGAPPGAWRWPLRGEVARRFGYARAHAFAAGQRRGVDLAAGPGARVGAACGGRVTFAGRVPAGGRGVTVRCGALVATHLGLGRLSVRRGAIVLPGERLGSLGADGRLRLGARRAGDRFGYVDPEMLLGDAPPATVPGLPLGRAPRTPAAVPRVLRVPAERRSPAPRAMARPAAPAPAGAAPARIPAAAWAGVVLLAAGVPVGGLVRRDRRRRAARAAAGHAMGTAGRL